jgi:hypothetical protein
MAFAKSCDIERLGEIAATPHDKPPEVLLMLTVYIDESDQESPEHVVVGGFVGTCEQWKAFTPDWRTGLGNRKGLHMRELRWKQPRTERLLARLGPIPHAHGLKPVFGVVRVSDYVDFLEHPTEQVLVGGYLCALHPLIRQVLLAFPGTERIKWIFEEQEQYEPLVRLVFANYELLNCKERCAGVEFVPKDSTSLTQPSDYLVYAQLQRMRDEDSQKSKWCAPILQNLPSEKDSIIGRDLIRHIVRQALYWAIVQTVAETGRGVQEIRAGRETRSKVIESVRRMQALPSRASSSLPQPREPEPSLRHWGLRTWFLKRYAIVRILGRTQEQALLELQSALSLSERIRLAAAVDEVLAQTASQSSP